MAADITQRDNLRHSTDKVNALNTALGSLTPANAVRNTLDATFATINANIEAAITAGHNWTDLNNWFREQDMSDVNEDSWREWKARTGN